MTDNKKTVLNVIEESHKIIDLEIERIPEKTISPINQLEELDPSMQTSQEDLALNLSADDQRSQGKGTGDVTELEAGGSDDMKLLDAKDDLSIENVRAKKNNQTFKAVSDLTTVTSTNEVVDITTGNKSISNSDSDITEPKMVGSGEVDPGAANTDSVHPNFVDPDVIDPDVVDPDVVDPDVVDPDVETGAGSRAIAQSTIDLTTNSEIINLADLPPEVQIENLQAAGLTPEQIAGLVSQAQVEELQLETAEDAQNLQLIGLPTQGQIAAQGENIQTLVANHESTMSGNLQIVDLTNGLVGSNGEQEAVDIPAEMATENIDISGGLTADNLQALMSAGNLQIVNITQEGVEGDGADLSGVVLPDNLKALASQVMAGNLQIINFNQEGEKSEDQTSEQTNNTNLQLLAQEILAGNLQIVDLSEQSGDNPENPSENSNENVVIPVIDTGERKLTESLKTEGMGDDSKLQPDGNNAVQSPSPNSNLDVSKSRTSATESKRDGILSTIPVTCSTSAEQVITSCLSSIVSSEQIGVEKSPLSVLTVPVSVSPNENSQAASPQQQCPLLAGGGQGFTEANIDVETGQIVFSQPSMSAASNNPVPQGTILVSDQSAQESANNDISQTLNPRPSIIVGSQSQSQASTDEIPALQQIQAQMQPVLNGRNQPEAITINLPKSSIQNLQLAGSGGNVGLGEDGVTVLQGDYNQLLDIVLKNSNLQVQGEGIDGSQPLVLAEVDGDSGEMVAVKGPDGHHITLTPQQMSALNVAASNNQGLSIACSNGSNTLNIANKATTADNKTPIGGSTVVSGSTVIHSGVKVSDTSAASMTLKDDNGDEIEFEDDMDDEDHFETDDGFCSDRNGLQPSGIDGVDLSNGGSEAGKYKCSECGLKCDKKAALRKHMILVHANKQLETAQKTTSKCIHPGCDKIFYHRQKMIDHLKEEHGVNCVQEDLVFNSWDEFFVWKEKEEDANFVHFSKNSTHTNTANYMLVNFTCQREGKVGYKYKGGQQKKYKDVIIGEKICPARMRARLDKPTGRVTVQYCTSHNHKLSFQDFLYRRMPDRLRNEIREKLIAGMSSEEIYKELKSTDNLRESRGERFAPSKRQFVTLVNIKTIAKRMSIKEVGSITKQFFLDPDPYAIQVQKLLDETFNPVLLYKDVGATIEVGPQEIEKLISNGLETLLLIGIQTKEQKDMFVKHAHKLILIDITDAIVAPTQYIITVKVLDEYNKGYPAAFLITNSRDETVLFYFFRELHNRVADTDIKINAVMTENSCNEYYAFRSVFGEHVKHLLCKWNLHRAWCQKIHEECAGDEALQQELYFIFVTMLEEQDLTKFENIATEFVNNYQPRCANFIQFFISNYLSQPEVWASCHRNNPHSDCDEVLYGDRLHERVKKEIKNNQQVRSVDDLLDLVLKFEHEDYFNRGLNLMLNPPEGDLLLSEHLLGLKIKSAFVTENYTADNKWLVKTRKRDPSDLQSMKEESFVVTWKADICEKDFCRERCLKLTCFGLCGHLYACSCDASPITPCSHIHKVHSLRIGVTQYQNDDNDLKDSDDIQIVTPSATAKNTTGPHENLIVSITEEKKKEGNKCDKLNLVNHGSTTASTAADKENRSREEKIRKIKMDLVRMYKFLERENIQKYSLDFIDTGLKKVIDECKIIDSIGHNKSVEEFTQGNKRKTSTLNDDLQDFEVFVKQPKRRKVMGNSVPVIVEIEPNPAVYNTFRKKACGSTTESTDEKMMKLSRSKSITVNIESDVKSQRNKKSSSNAMQHKDNDIEWTPKEPKRGRPKGSTNRPKNVKSETTVVPQSVAPPLPVAIAATTIPQTVKPVATPSPAPASTTTANKIKIGQKRRRGRSNKPEDWRMAPMDHISDPLKPIIQNGNISLSMIEIKTLDAHIPEDEIAKCKAFAPGWDRLTIPESIVDSFFYSLSQKYNILSLTVEQMSGLCNNQPHITRFWDPEEITGEKCCSYIFVPWRNPRHYFSLFVIDLMNNCISYLDSANVTDEDTTSGEASVLPMVNRAHTTLVGLMITEIPFDASRVKQFTWPLTIDTDVEFDVKNHTLRSMWYAHQLCNNSLLTDSSASMNDFRREIYDSIVGKCLEHIIEDNFSFCPVCSFDGNTAIECGRCNQTYHSACLRGVDIDSFVCTV